MSGTLKLEVSVKHLIDAGKVVLGKLSSPFGR